MGKYSPRGRTEENSKALSHVQLGPLPFSANNCNTGVMEAVPEGGQPTVFLCPSLYTFGY